MIYSVLILTIGGLACAVIGGMVTAIILRYLTPEAEPVQGEASPDMPYPTDRASCPQDPHMTDHAHYSDTRPDYRPAPFLDDWLTDRLLRTDRWAAQAGWHLDDWHAQAAAQAAEVDIWLHGYAGPPITALAR